MKLIIILVLTAACLVNFSEGYLCYECNSTYDRNCFDFSPQQSYYKGVYCDTDGTGESNCYSVHISDRKVRKMYRGCGKVGICDEYERKDESSIQMKVLDCTECGEHYCNSVELVSFSAFLKISLALFIFTIVTQRFIQ